MSLTAAAFDRRVFLEGLGLSTAGLCLGFHALGAGKLPPGMPQTPAATAWEPNVFIHLDPSGLTTIVCHRSEMGQGIRSSLPVLLADEMGADMAHVRIVQADGDKKYGDQNTDGSSSIRIRYEELRHAAATMRVLLVEAAAQKWHVQPSSCFAQGHVVRHSPTKRQLGFGELALAAAALPVPEAATVPLRPMHELKHVGTDLPLLDAPAFVGGTAAFGADVQLPGMLVALIARPPVVGGTVRKFDEAAAMAVAGVKHVIAMPVPQEPYMFQPWGGVAVVATNTWAAMKGREALGVTWESGANASYNSAEFRASLTASAAQPGLALRQVGDCEKALASATTKLEADYYVPHLPHVPMEPPVAIARYVAAGGGSCEVWAPTQNPQAARQEVARVLGMDEAQVTVHVTMLGGGFGRKSKADFVGEAAFLAKATGTPVRVQWTREDDIHNDYLNTVSAQKLTAGLDEHGKVVAWRHRTAYPPIGSLFDQKTTRPGLGDLQQGVLDVPLQVANVLAEACEAKSHVRTGWLRSVYNIFHSFAVNSFIDEIAHARGISCREMMLELYGPPHQWSLAELGVKELKNYGATLEQHPVDAGRLRHVVERVTANAKWPAHRADGKGERGFGLAAHRSFLSYVAVVAAVRKTKGGALKMDEVWVVVDAGTIINSDRVRSQMEGSVINGMNHALYGGVTHQGGAVEQSNFDGVQLVRMGIEPARLHIEIIKSVGAPGGVGEPGVPPVAPAIGNAIFALTGKRLREMPFAVEFV